MQRNLFNLHRIDAAERGALTDELVADAVPQRRVLRAVDDGVDERHERRLVRRRLGVLQLGHHDAQLAALVRHLLQHQPGQHSRESRKLLAHRRSRAPDRASCVASI